MDKTSSEYTRKRNFDVTSEPKEEALRGRSKKAVGALRFVIQKHDARNLHYDFRLELDGTLKSWAVPKGPSLDPQDKRLAIHVEDHPLSYAAFEGRIPRGQYGAGDVIVWDQGIWQPHDDPLKAYASGKLKFSLVGEKLSGDWTLVRTRLKGSGDKDHWLLIKERDELARPSSEYSIVEAQPQSVITGALLARVKANPRDPKPDGPIPDVFKPQLATWVSEPPSGDWLYEIKFDGYRILARIKCAAVRLYTRNGHDWTEKMPLQVKAIEALELQDSWLDG
ncbi:MAG: DNA polymerase ligase N-terminal domain-containing protein [Formivibrio sp.]|nr:DNA polymerase ligase N-terminal domain-containing protein [Formivibrio sp.]